MSTQPGLYATVDSIPVRVVDVRDSTVYRGRVADVEAVSGEPFLKYGFFGWVPSSTTTVPTFCLKDVRLEGV